MLLYFLLTIQSDLVDYFIKFLSLFNMLKMRTVLHNVREAF